MQIPQHTDSWPVEIDCPCWQCCMAESGNLGRQSAVSGTRIFKSGLRKCESSGLVADVKIWALYTAELDSAVSQTPGKPRTAEHNSAVSCTPQSLTLRCMAYHVAWLCGVPHTAEPDSAVSGIPRSLTLRCPAHCSAWLFSVLQFAEPDSTVSRTVLICLLWNFLQVLTSFNPNKSDIGEKTPTFVQYDFTPWCLKLNIFF